MIAPTVWLSNDLFVAETEAPLQQKPLEVVLTRDDNISLPQ